MLIGECMMTEIQQSVITAGMYLETLMLLAKVITACVLLDTVCFVVFGFAWLTTLVRRN
jgi:hypothetical protein